MYYFMSDLHGAEEAYEQMKEKISFKANDELYILGDIFDGNDNNPKACLNILNDVMKHDNIHLILGNHEYAHVMYYLLMGDKEEQRPWKDYLCDSICQGKPLLEYFHNHLSEKEKNYYIEYLLSCEIADMIRIGDNQFYLVHGSPASCIGNNSMKWQEDVTMNTIELDHNYKFAIKSDPNFEGYKKKCGQIDFDNLTIICGHTPTKYIFEQDYILLSKTYSDAQKNKYQKPIFYKDKLMIDCGCRGNTLGKAYNGWISDVSCIGIDAAGMFCEHLLGPDDTRYKRFGV